MKKVLSILLALVMLTSSMSNILVFAADISTVSKITAESTYSFPGGTVDVEVTLSNNPSIYNLLMSFEYDSTALKLIAVSNGTAMSDVASFTPPKNMASGCSASWYYIDEPDTYKDGSLVVLTFEVLETAEAGESYSVSVTNVTAEDVDGTECDISVVNGKVSIIDYIPGDVNGDGKHTIRKDVSEFNQYIVDGCKYDPLGYAVQINENAGDVNDDNKINIRDVIQINKYIVDGCTYDPNGYAVKLLPHTPRCQHTYLIAVPAKEASCTEDGNKAYWVCECGKYFGDSAATNEIEIEDTVVEATHTPGDEATCTEPQTCTKCGEILIVALGHTYSDVWSSDATYHWHVATCGHNDEVSNKAEHNLDANGLCTICSYQKDMTIKLATPVITSIEYDTVYWEPIPNAEYYTVVINDNYERTLKGSSCLIKNALWDGNAIPASECGNIKVKVRAEGYDNYLTSNWSDINSSYYYVPETENEANEATATAFKIGYGYNLVENPYLRVKEYGSTNSVLNINKLFTVGSFRSAQGTQYDGYGYYYESIDDFLSKTSLSADFGMEVGCQLIGSVKTQFELDSSVEYSTHEYNCTYVGKHEIAHFDYYISDLLTDEIYHCLSNNFIKEVKRQTTTTANMTDEELVAYLYKNYGTHAILGVRTGGEYAATYTVQTNNEKIASDVKLAFEVSTGGGAIDQIIQKNFNFGVELEEELEKNTSNTKTSFTTSYYGGNGEITTTMTDYSATKNSWSVDGTNAASLGFTNNGAIAISSLIDSIDHDLAIVYEAYISKRADASYAELYSQYTMPSTLPMSVEHVDGENVLAIDLSSYQSSGNLENVYSSTLRSGILSVSPIMLGKRIDKIVVRGAFANGEADTNALIDSFSIALTKEWSRDVDIIIENLGTVCASSNGIVDTSAVNRNIDVNVLYQGTNMIKELGDIYYLYILDDSTDYVFSFDLDSDDVIILDNIATGRLVLPIANKATDDYSFEFAGWLDENDALVTDSNGEFLESYELPEKSPTLHAKWNPKTFKITLNSQNATQNGTERFYVLYDEGMFENFEGTVPVTQIEIPQRTGYIFAGYYTNVENNATALANGGTQYIDSNGNITATANSFNTATTLYALWKPMICKMTMHNGDVVYGTYYQQYGEGTFWDAECIGVYSNIEAPTKQGYTFEGFFDDNDVEYISANGTIIASKDNNYKTVLSDTSLYARWKPNTYTVRYDANEGSGAMPSSTHTYDIAKALTANTFTRTGYDFNGWKDENNNSYKNEQSVENLIVENDGVITLYAQWKPHEYTITYNANGGSGTMNKSFHVYGEESNLSENEFFRDGYSFAGWNTQANGKGTPYEDEEKVLNLTATNGENIDLFAIWSEGTYTVKFNANGGNVTPKQKDVVFGSEYGELPTPTRDGYSFNGWTYNNKEITDSSVVNVGSTHTLTALWTPNTYTVEYKANGGSGTMPSSTHTFDVAKELTANTFTQTGYDFNGWKDTNDNTYENSESVKNLTTEKGGVIKLYAQWKVKEYTVTWSVCDNVAITVKREQSPLRGADPGTLASGSKVYYGDVLTVTYTAATNYSISNKGEPIIHVTENVTKNKIWATAQGNPVTVKFNLNTTSNQSDPYKCYSSVSPSNISDRTVYYGSKYNKDGSLPTPTAFGYSFDGWWTSANGGSQITGDTIVKLTGNQELFAHWTKTKSGYTYVKTPTDFGKIGTSGNYYIVADITLSGTWTPISSFSNGTIDGGNHTISNLTSNATGITTAKSYGFIVTLNSSATVKDIKFNNVTLTADYSGYDCDKDVAMGCVAAINRGIISNVHISGATIKIDSVGSTSGNNAKRHYANVGSICGYNYGTINGKCTVNNVTIYAHSRISKGVGYAYAGGVAGCHRAGTITNVTVSNYNVQSFVRSADGQSAGKLVSGAGGIVGAWMDGASLTSTTLSGSQYILADYDGDAYPRTRYYYGSYGPDKVSGSWTYGYKGSGFDY